MIIGYNNIRDEGAIHISELLEINKTITELDLGLLFFSLR